jgi:hypothetical protein
MTLEYMDILHSLNESINHLNNSKYFIGFMMILLNVGSRYVFLELGKTHDLFFNNKIVRRALIFTIFFVATRDIIVSIILSAFFIIFFLELTHEKSPYCIIPKGYIKLDVNNDGLVSADEIKRAYLTLKNAGEIEAFKNKMNHK